MQLFSEKSVVEDYFIQRLQAKGWRFIPADSLERESFEEPLLVSVLTRVLNNLNTEKGLGEAEVRQVLNELKFKTAGAEHVKQVLNYFKMGVPVKFEKERVVKYIRLFDYDNVSNNDFIVSSQVVHQNGDKKIRNDLILYVNGIPLVNIECKNPASLTEDWYAAYKQIREYEEMVPELYKYVQIGVAAEYTVKYFPTTPWSRSDVKIHEWRHPGFQDPVDAIVEMLSPENLLNIIRSYLFFRVERGVATKVITRYMQYQAAEKIFNRVILNLEGKDTKNKGLIWHWQGSGKTLTMIFAANKLYLNPVLDKPTIFFIVDREELQEQLYQEFTALDIVKPEVVDSIEVLRRILRFDENRGKRGIFITLIHKFRPEELVELQKELESLSEKQETVQNRKNIILFIDEAHRTQYGLLAAQMKQILKNAFAFAFTGTPIMKIGRDTYQEFSYPSEGEHYLDKYFITESIKDGCTLKIAYQPRLEKDVHLDKAMLEEFIQSDYEEIPEEYREKTEEKIKRKLNQIKVILENPQRIDKIAYDITEHFKENLDGRFKGLIVAVSRLACIRYKRVLDKLLPKEYSEVVMTYNRTDPQEIQDCLKELTNRYYSNDTEEIRRKIIERFKEDDYPKILIVTDMLLTGFDAPILQTMYLDKPLKEHRLLQAIARTNRPFNDHKTVGLIIDYVGVLKEFIHALETYSKEDITGVLIPIDDIAKEFTHLIEETISLFQGVPLDRSDRETMFKAFEIITTDEKTTKLFQKNIRQLRKIFELLGPHQIKLQKLKEYNWLIQVYTFYLHWLRQQYYEEQKYVRKYYPKTLKYVYSTTKINNIEALYPDIQFDADYLRNLQEKVKSKEEKAANILFTLNRFILVERYRNPVYETLTDKVERLLKLWREKIKDYEKIYSEGVEIIKEINQLQNRQKQLDLPNLDYSILLTLEKTIKERVNLVEEAKTIVNIIKPYLFRNWQIQSTARKKIEGLIREYLRKYIRKYNLNLDQIELLQKQIMENVKNYG